MLLRNRSKMQGAIAVAVVCLAVLSLSGAGPVAAQGGSIVLDGAGGDWDAGWQMADDGLDVFITDSQLHPHQAPTFARSGYDAIALWAHYQPADDTWYFRIDVDGRAGDSDSQTGTADDPGVGTHGPDQGPLVASPFLDGIGLGNSEAYKLGFQCAQGAAGLTAEISNSEAILPGVVAPTTMGLDGLAVYSTTVPGVVEFAFHRATLFPGDVACPQLWLSAQVGDNNDRVSDDQIAATRSPSTSPCSVRGRRPSSETRRPSPSTTRSPPRPARRSQAWCSSRMCPPGPSSYPPATGAPCPGA